MDIYNKFLKLTKNTNISNVLFFNDKTLTKQDLINLNQFVPHIYVSFYNAFQLRSMMVQLRSYRNIHFIEPSNIPILNYDVLSTPEINCSIELLLSKIKTFKYINISSNIQINPPVGFIIDSLDNNLFKRDGNIIIDEKTLNNKNFFGEMHDAMKKDLGITDAPTDKKNEEIKQKLPKSSNIAIEFQKSVKKLNKPNEDEISNNKFQTSNNKFQTLNKKINISDFPKGQRNLIFLKNVAPSTTSFNSPIKKFVNDGILDVFCFLEFKKDYDKFISSLNYLSKNYKNSKLFVVLSGNTILKYFNENSLKDFDYFLIKSKIKEDEFKYKEIFNIISNGSLRTNFKNIDLNKNILDFINEDCTDITNI